MSTRFDEFNCHAQCRKCNWLLQGNDKEYAIAIEKKYGKEILNRLIYFSRVSRKWSRFELELQIQDYKKKVDELLKLKK
jgi:hypothetical protein